MSTDIKHADAGAVFGSAEDAYEAVLRVLGGKDNPMNAKDVQKLLGATQRTNLYGASMRVSNVLCLMARKGLIVAIRPDPNKRLYLYRKPEPGELVTPHDPMRPVIIDAPLVVQAQPAPPPDEDEPADLPPPAPTVSSDDVISRARRNLARAQELDMKLTMLQAADVEVSNWLKRLEEAKVGYDEAMKVKEQLLVEVDALTAQPQWSVSKVDVEVTAEYVREWVNRIAGWFLGKSIKKGDKDIPVYYKRGVPNAFEAVGHELKVKLHEIDPAFDVKGRVSQYDMGSGWKNVVTALIRVEIDVYTTMDRIGLTYRFTPFYQYWHSQNMRKRE